MKIIRKIYTENDMENMPKECMRKELKKIKR